MIPPENPTALTVKSLAIPAAKGAEPSDDIVKRAQDAALKLEASFLAEMLKSAGFGEQTNSFSGSAGEDQFASFHRDALANHMAKAGGIGLAEHFFNAMMEAQNDAGRDS
ncbi:MAG: rod-binding protein [Pseudomonadota bacterium]